MGNTARREERKTKKFQRGELMKKVLFGVGAGLVIGVALTMPGALLAFKPFFDGKKVSRQSFQKTYKALVRRKLVRVKKEKEKYVLEMTEAGRKRLRRYQTEDITIPVPRIWDNKWRIIVFDIPEREKAAREALRNTLLRLECYRFQDSVFVHPFECENEIDFITEVFGIQKYVYCFTVAMKKVPHPIAYHFASVLSMYPIA